MKKNVKFINWNIQSKIFINLLRKGISIIYNWFYDICRSLSLFKKHIFFLEKDPEYENIC